MKNYISKLFHNPIILSILFMICISALAYLIFINSLGYYNDDWHLVASETSGVSLFRMFVVDRPAVGISYEILGPILGDKPLNWHIAAFTLRVGCGIITFLLLHMLWPKAVFTTAALSSLINIYPGYLQQPAALTYINHFLSYGAALFSLAATVFILKYRGHIFWKVLLGTLATFATLCYLAMDEFMIGLEGIRLVLVFFVHAGQGITGFWKRIWRSIIISMPNLLAAGGFLYWRFFIFNSARPTTNTDLLYSQYLSDPLNAFLRLCLETGRDFFEVTVLAWFVPLYQTAQRLSYPDLAWGVLVGILGVVCFWLFLRWMRTNGALDAQENSAQSPIPGAVVIGIICILLAVIPVILAGRDVQFANNFDRYTLHATLGVTILLVGLFSLLGAKTRWFILSGLIAVSLITHYGNNIHYRTFWEVQRQLWWQLSWRAPGIYGDTVLITSLPAGYGIMEDYQVWAPANLIFSSEPLAIGAEVLNNDTSVYIIHGDTVNRQFRNIAYKREFRLSLILSMTGPDACLHVLDGDALELPNNEVPLTRLVAPYSDISRINPSGPGFIPPQEIFGEEPERNWCYYYQQGSLARQAGDWEQIAMLGDEADSHGFVAADPSEWMPFLEAYMELGRFDDAAQIALLIQQNPAVTRQLCERFTEGQEPPSYFTSLDSFSQTGALLCP